MEDILTENEIDVIVKDGKYNGTAFPNLRDRIIIPPVQNKVNFIEYKNAKKNNVLF